MYSKKAQIPTIKVIAIIFTVVIFLISWVLILNINISIDQKQINTQLAIKKIIDGNCFSDNYATVHKEKFTQKTFEECYGKNDNILIMIYLEKKTIYSNKKMFSEQSSKCSTTSSIKCTQIRYPIIYKSQTGTTIKQMTIQTITT